MGRVCSAGARGTNSICVERAPMGGEFLDKLEPFLLRRSQDIGRDPGESRSSQLFTQSLNDPQLLVRARYIALTLVP